MEPGRDRNIKGGGQGAPQKKSEFEQNLRGEGMHQVAAWGRKFPGRGKSQCKVHKESCET